MEQQRHLYCGFDVTAVATLWCIINSYLSYNSYIMILINQLLNRACNCRINKERYPTMAPTVTLVKPSCKNFKVPLLTGVLCHNIYYWPTYMPEGIWPSYRIWMPLSRSSWPSQCWPNRVNCMQCWSNSVSGDLYSPSPDTSIHHWNWVSCLICFMRDLRSSSLISELGSSYSNWRLEVDKFI